MTDKMIDDLALPDLEDLDARLTRLEKTMGAKVDVLPTTASDLVKTPNAKIDKSLSGFDRLLATMEATLATMVANHTSLLHAMEIQRRLQRLEAMTNKVR